MAKKKTTENKTEELFKNQAKASVQPITETLEVNYMPYAMSVIIQRAIPEIDGFKPAHRKLLYTMYKMGLMTGPRTKSVNVSGATLKLHPHGDQSVYETLVRLTRANESLLHPFIDSKGTFGKHYSKDMAPSAARYTEVKLDPFCAEIFRGLDKNAVDMVPNYDNTMTEPKLLPTAFPNILVSPNMGIAVGMSTNICSFNLSEICDVTCEMLDDPSIDVDRVLDIMPAPDFTGGAIILYDRAQMAEIYKTGRGSFKMRAKYEYDPKANCINILEIPDSTTIEPIITKIGDLVKAGTVKDITDYRDEIGLEGFRLTLDLRKGVDPDKLMTKLFKLTPLESPVSCNFNVIINQRPLTLGVIDILAEWIKFRMGCVRREVAFELERKKEKLHLLEGLGRILLDIDKAIRIIRGTKSESDVVPNLMEGFSIDEIQAEYVADIKLRHLNREYILNRIAETDALRRDIAELEKTVKDDKRIKKIIKKQLGEIKAKYGIPRKTDIVQIYEVSVFNKDEEIENCNCKVVMTKGGYFKKLNVIGIAKNITEQNVKEGDSVVLEEDAENFDTLLFFSDKAQCYKSKVSDFEFSKPSLLGDYVPAKLDFDDGERFLYMKRLKEFKDGANMVFIFENGKGVKVPLNSYETKGNRAKLKSAYSDRSPIVAAFCEEKKPLEIVLYSSDGKCIQISSSLITQSSTRTAQGTTLFTLKKGAKVQEAKLYDQSMVFPKSPKKIKVPAAGVPIK